MPVLAHLSDLHFGRTDAAVVEALLDDLTQARPDLVVISGDLTQRARSSQFAEARAFLDRLPAPALVVPGNHDLAPLHSPLNRLFRPRAKFHRHLAGHAERQIWQDNQVVVVGLDSTRHLRWTSGKLRSSHLDRIDTVLAGAEDSACKVAFLHHPPATALSGHPFEVLADRGIDLVLAGHVHKVRVELIAGAHHSSCILAQASTACSTRLRDEANGYGLIHIAMPDMVIEMRGWTGHAFHTVRRQAFHKSGSHWRHGPHLA
ncbi:MAG: metallophosphoesterase [Rhodospirillaceae bacterium]|nr:metallophosphoesterase [Rhodospirillales bacterium]